MRIRLVLLLAFGLTEALAVLDDIEATKPGLFLTWNRLVIGLSLGVVTFLALTAMWLRWRRRQRAVASPPKT